MKRTLIFAMCISIFFLSAPRLCGEVKQSAGSVFVIEQDLVLPASPEAVYDAVTGDITPWWDHSFSAKPKKLYIDARPGGGFYEIFDDSGDGAWHATVIYAQRGKRLTFNGPLGLSGRAMDVVTTYNLKPDPAGTRFHLTVAIAGQIDEATAKIIDDVWHHFLFERFKPYIESGEYKKHLQAPVDKK